MSETEAFGREKRERSERPTRRVELGSRRQWRRKSDQGNDERRSSGATEGEEMRPKRAAERSDHGRVTSSSVTRVSRVSYRRVAEGGAEPFTRRETRT